MCSGELLRVARPEIAPRSPDRSSCVANVGWPVEQFRKPREYAPQVGTHLKRSLAPSAIVSNNNQIAYLSHCRRGKSSGSAVSVARLGITARTYGKSDSTFDTLPDVLQQTTDSSTVAATVRESVRVLRSSKNAA